MAGVACRAAATVGLRARSGRSRQRRCGALVLLALTCLLGAESAPAEKPASGLPSNDPGQILHVRGMTFVASEGTSNEIVLRAERARFYPSHEIADLEVVEVQVEPGDDRVGFSMACEGGQLNLSTQGFVAEGNVVGTIEGGRQFEASWVAYDDAAGMLYTDDPVVIIDESGHYRGGGFRYHVEEGRFRLLGGATVVQDR